MTLGSYIKLETQPIKIAFIKNELFGPLIVREFNGVKDYLGKIAVFTLVAIHYKAVVGEEVHVFSSVKDSWFAYADEF